MDSGKVEYMKFLQLNQIDDYNNSMGGVEIVDQLEGVIDWTIGYALGSGGGLFVIGISEVIQLTRILYIKVNQKEGIEKSDLMAHLEFRKKITMAWIDSDTIPTCKLT